MALRGTLWAWMMTITKFLSRTDFFSALYLALDRLEELDPEARNEPWFMLLESFADKTLVPHIEKAYRTRKELHPTLSPISGISKVVQYSKVLYYLSGSFTEEIRNEYAN